MRAQLLGTLQAPLAETLSVIEAILSQVLCTAWRTEAELEKNNQ